MFPAIFLGIAPATFAVVWFDVSPTLAVAAGAAAGMAAGTRLLITSTLFAALLVGSAGADAVPAAALAEASAWLTMKAVDRRAEAATRLDSTRNRPSTRFRHSTWTQPSRLPPRPSRTAT